jgi:hypothetical protein
MMMSAFQKRVLVQPGGRVEFTAPELPEGVEADVIVLVRSEAQPPPTMSPLEAFQALQASMRLTPEAAKRWTDEVRAEREAWGKPE